MLLGGAAGSWAEYALLVGGYPVGPYVRFLIVGREAVGGTEGTWVELWISQRPGSATQAYRMLLAEAPSGEIAVQRAVARLLGGQVREIPVKELLPRGEAAAASGAPRRGADAPGHMGESNAILTAAGSFSSRQVRLGREEGGTRAWFSEQVPLFGLVRLEVSGQLGLELHAFGEGGESVVPSPGGAESSQTDKAPIAAGSKPGKGPPPASEAGSW